MSKEIEELRRKLLGGNQADTVFQAVVTKVDEQEFTCEVKRDGAVDYFDVRLRGVIDSGLQGIALIPKLQSTVLVCRIGSSNELFVCQFSEIDKVLFTARDAAFTFNGDKLLISQGEKVTVTVDAEGLTVQAGETAFKASTAGLSLTRKNSGLKKTLDDLLKAIQNLTVTTGVGPSGPPINIQDFIQVQTDLANYLEE